MIFVVDAFEGIFFIINLMNKWTMLVDGVSLVGPNDSILFPDLTLDLS